MNDKEYFEQEWAKMLAGEVYDGDCAELHRLLADCREMIARFNALPPMDMEAQDALLRRILGSAGPGLHVNQPFRCDYGRNIHVGARFFANFNLTVLDEAEVRIGDDCFIGPNVSIYTACHPLDAERRNRNVQWAEAVNIGNSVWIGGNAVILPGVTVGDGAVIAAAAVVTRDVPPRTLVAGNPARPLRSL